MCLIFPVSHSGSWGEIWPICFGYKWQLPNDYQSSKHARHYQKERASENKNQSEGLVRGADCLSTVLTAALPSEEREQRHETAEARNRSSFCVLRTQKSHTSLSLPPPIHYCLLAFVRGHMEGGAAVWGRLWVLVQLSQQTGSIPCYCCIYGCIRLFQRL